MKITLATLFLLTLTTCATTTPARTSAEEAAVRATVASYLHGLHFNDVAGLERAFWPDAKLYFIKRDGSLGQLTQQDWYKSFISHAGQEEAGDFRITAVDVTGDAASVKVVETYEKSVYVDYLNLLRWNDEWRIVNKIYTTYAR